MTDVNGTVLAQFEKPLDRLNYFNGQRLEAADLKLEQQYHIRVRRWLNKSLYTTGIARGLEVARDPANSMNVIVSPGLALDSEGREILLLDQVSIPVVGKPRSSPGIPDGTYLTIQYNEQVTEEEQDGCTVQVSKKRGCGCGRGNGNGSGKSSLAWGGPALVRATPILGFTDYLPSATSGKIVLAQIELDNSCNVVSVHAEVRRYVGAASDALVHQFALEGARDFDSKNPQRIYFHIRGRQPHAVTLYLRAEKFSTLYYTELGRHNHNVNVNVNSVTIPAHHHTLTLDPTTGQSGTAGQHTHSYDDIRAATPPATNVPLNRWVILIAPVPDVQGVDWADQSLSGWTNARFNIQNAGDHSHWIPNKTDDNSPQTLALSGTGTSDPYGVTDVNADTGRPALSYIADLQVIVDDQDVTNSILTQLQDARPTQNWNRFGDGSAGHDLVVNGTGDIKLDLIPPLSFDEREHYIELSVASGGGRILYNLYVE